MRQLSTPNLKTYVTRYKMYKELLVKQPENKELLERKIEEHQKAIIEYVTSDSFLTQLNYLNL